MTFTQQQAQAMYELLLHLADNWHDTPMGGKAVELLKQLEGE